MNPWPDITPEDILRMQDEHKILDEEAERSPSYDQDFRDSEDKEQKSKKED